MLMETAIIKGQEGDPVEESAAGRDYVTMLQDELLHGLETRRLMAAVEAELFGSAACLHIGRYRVIDRLGAGGMGVVYLCHDEELGRQVALKLVGGQGRPELESRLRREAQALAKVEHPNVVPVFDVGEH
ncbi:MAG: hypothetical protein KC431_28740, partial [Myxococcales bacterium]|nr:hypothetical protein [Myxococcales bacterium]